MSETKHYIRPGERLVCPFCGEKRGNRQGIHNGKQGYLCRACKRCWRGPLAPLPDRTCPYCKGFCVKKGTRPEGKGDRRKKTPLQQWLDRGASATPLPPPVQIYKCTVCGKVNTELWPDTPKVRRTAHRYDRSRYPYRVKLYLDAAAENGLVEYQYRRKISAAQAVREIFAKAIRPNFLAAAFPRPAGEPPRIPPGAVLHPLPDGRPREAERRRGKLWGHREVIVVRTLSVDLDAPAYLGLLRATGDSRTRQEAARSLLSARRPTCVGATASPGADDAW